MSIFRGFVAGSYHMFFDIANSIPSYKAKSDACIITIIKPSVQRCCCVVGTSKCVQQRNKGSFNQWWVIWQLLW